MELFLALFSGIALGCLHAFDIDHIVAVSAFTDRQANRWSAARMGAMWGLGHTAVLLVVGSILVIFRLSIPQIIQDGSELLVGVLLVVLGIWTIRGVMKKRRIHIHTHEHDGAQHVHFHSHHGDADHTHSHTHSLFALGAVHGFAGTGSIVVLIPVSFAESWIPGMTFLTVFGIGSMISMAAFSLILSAVANTSRSERLLTSVQGFAGLASLAVGILWIAERFMEAG